jgi:hypothetical protein
MFQAVSWALKVAYHRDYHFLWSHFLGHCLSISCSVANGQDKDFRKWPGQGQGGLHYVVARFVQVIRNVRDLADCNCRQLLQWGWHELRRWHCHYTNESDYGNSLHSSSFYHYVHLLLRPWVQAYA